MQFIAVRGANLLSDNIDQFLVCEGKTPSEAVASKMKEITGEEKEYQESSPRLNGIAFFGEVLVFPLH